MKIYSFSTQLEAAVAELLADTRVLFSELWNYRGPAYVKALRYLKAKRPGAFQIRHTGAEVDHPGDRMMWDLLSASDSAAFWRFQDPENQWCQWP
ncbi:MAG: hypothetical protein JO251_23365 [Verrucomicrobia bacterium]|nr:hypothetical protein [Verrucomicrobiota bacterium]